MRRGRGAGVLRAGRGRRDEGRAGILRPDGFGDCLVAGHLPVGAGGGVRGFQMAFVRLGS